MFDDLQLFTNTQMVTYSIQQVANMANVSVRTLHVYDELGLLTPAYRTETNYRRYSQTELLRLQQILLYKMMDLPLKDIKAILDDPDYNVVSALRAHKQRLVDRAKQFAKIITTIETTLQHLETTLKSNPSFLYDGFNSAELLAYRNEALELWPEATRNSEAALKTLSKDEFEEVVTQFQKHWRFMSTIIDLDPCDSAVQDCIRKHYHLTRIMWGTSGSDDTQKEAFMGLADLYLSDRRYSDNISAPFPEFAQFMKIAIEHFGNKEL